MRKKAEAPREWSPHDVAILHTRDILDRSLNDAIHSRPANPVSFRTAYGTDEKVLVSGDYQLCTFRGIGDGSYVHTSGVLLARGPGRLRPRPCLRSARR